jgi:beta-D-galactosyl-(1->4)-L-rhamnose phosphorylase
MGIYLPSFEISQENTRLLLNLILYAGGENLDGEYITDNTMTECAFYPESKTLVVLNNSDTEQTAAMNTAYGKVTVTLEPYENKILWMGK